MNILMITHADFEGPGVIADWVKSKHHIMRIAKPYAGEVLPHIDDFDMLVIMGGPQSTLKLDEFPYLEDEIHLIKAAVAQHKRIIGFCLGAQLIGEALGARAAKSPEKEIGVYPLTLTEAGEKDRLLEGSSSVLPAIHWHNDMPGLTDKSVVLAISEGCPRQIVRYAEKIYGFQCHLEITLQGIRDLIENAPGDLKPSAYTMTEAELLTQDYEAVHRGMFTILDRFELL